MLTVKWIVQTTKGSVERIFAADDVAIAYRNNPLGDAQKIDGSDFKVGRYAVKSAVLVINPNDSSSDRCLADGICYVMNAAGKTVGSYQLSDEVIEATDSLPTPDPIILPVAA